jgi:hypothetical protein
MVLQAESATTSANHPSRVINNRSETKRISGLH